MLIIYSGTLRLQIAIIFSMAHRRALDAINLVLYVEVLEVQAMILESIVDTTSSPAMLDMAKTDLEQLQVLLTRVRAKATQLKSAL